MLTFSRSAATEFKMRLIDLIGNAAHYVEIKTFHSYCFDLLGQIGSLEDAADIVARAARMIESGEVEIGRITRNVLVIDEAQDMDQHEAALVHALMRRNEDMRVIAVGDDDQNIYEFRGSDSRHMREFIDRYGAARYELLENYRSKQQIVALANSFVGSISKRMKSSPLIARNSESGFVSVTKHRSSNLEVAIVEDILRTYHRGTTCILTATNEEALRVVGLMLRNNIAVRLVQTANGFDLYQLAELRYFLKLLGNHEHIPTISDDAWKTAIDKLCRAYQTSTCLPVCLKLLDTFAQVNRTKYRTDLVEFIHESKYEDFVDNSQNMILVSTMHKSKGREFDNVYLMLNRYDISADAAKRALYVALTRAKSELRVHYHGIFMERKSLPGIQYQQDFKLYPEPDEIVLELGHRDVVLNYFKDKKAKILSLRSGDPLYFDNEYFRCDDAIRRRVVKLSNKCREQIAALYAKGYRIHRAEIRFIAAWRGEEDTEESAVILPTLYLIK